MPFTPFGRGEHTFYRENTVAAAQLRAGTITAQEIVLGGENAVLRSQNFVSGTSGWSIDGNGNAEFNDVTVRGAIYATSGELGDLLLTGTMTMSGGAFRTAASGQRMEITDNDRIRFYTGLAAETTHGYIWARSDDATDPTLGIQSPSTTGQAHQILVRSAYVEINRNAGTSGTQFFVTPNAYGLHAGFGGSVSSPIVSLYDTVGGSNFEGIVVRTATGTELFRVGNASTPSLIGVNIANTGSTIGGATFDNGLLKIGTSSGGIAIDANEVMAFGSPLYLRTDSTSGVILGIGSTTYATVNANGVISASSVYAGASAAFQWTGTGEYFSRGASAVSVYAANAQVFRFTTSNHVAYRPIEVFGTDPWVRIHDDGAVWHQLTAGPGGTSNLRFSSNTTTITMDLTHDGNLYLNKYLYTLNGTIIISSTETSGTHGGADFVSFGGGYALRRFTSARKYKTDIDYEVDYLADIDLRPTIHWRLDEKRYRLGFIAEDITDQLPIAARYIEHDDGTIEVEGYDSPSVLAILAAKVNRLEERIAKCRCTD